MDSRLDTRHAPLPEDLGEWSRFRRRVGRHMAWARRDGVARLVEEDNLDPRVRVGTAWRKYRWRKQFGVEPGEARAVFLFGVQRSGTNMVVTGLEASPAVEVHNENDRRVFSRYQLRDDDTVRRVVMRSRHQLVLLKPLIDSHRAAELLDELALPTSPRAIWAYRNVDDRVRSAVAKFADVNRQVLIEIADGRGLHRWQAQGLSDEQLEFIRECDPVALSPESAAALFWIVRNGLFLEQGLADRADVHLVSYERVIREPEKSMRELADFVGLPYAPSLAAHVDLRSGGIRPPLDLDERVRRAATELGNKLDEVAAAHAERMR